MELAEALELTRAQLPEHLKVTAVTLEPPTATLTIEGNHNPLDLAQLLAHLPIHSSYTQHQTTGTVTITTTGPAIRHVPVRLPPDLADTVRRHRDATGHTATEQLLAAFTEHEQTLANRYHERRRRLGLPATGPRRRRRIGRTVQIWLTVDHDTLARLDRAAQNWCAGNRSHLATQLLAAYHQHLTNH